MSDVQYMELKFRKIILAFFLVIAANAVLAQPSAEAKKYFDAVCKIIDKRYIYRDSINLKAAKNQVMPMLDTARTKKDTYPAITELLHLIGANHMLLLPPAISDLVRFDTSRIIYPASGLLSDSIGYIKVPYYMSPEYMMGRWADSLIRLFYELDQHSLKGWIIDLRGNGGGAQAPIIGGLMPLIPDGILWNSYGYHEKPAGSALGRGGSFFEGNEKGGGWTFPTKYQNDLKQKDLPVALLMDSTTGSSGERAAIALLTNPKVRSFGGPTAGLLSGNTNVILSDGAMLIITVAVMKDRNGQAFPERLVPDFPVQPEPGKDSVLDAARKWLNSH